MDTAIEERLRLVVSEAFVHRRLLVAMFCVVSLGVLIVGLFWPKQYQSSTTILVEESNIIQPLMEGRAVPTQVRDRAQQARDLIFSRSVLLRVLDEAGWMNADTPPLEQERLMELLKRRTTVDNSGTNLIRIAFKDPDPERAQRTVEVMGRLFIEDSMRRKSEESRRAYDFIDQQVQEYLTRLNRIEAQLKEFRSRNAGLEATAAGEASARITTLRRQIEDTELALAEERIRRKSLEKQLSGEAGVSASISREGQYRSQIAELNSQLDGLLLKYTETHPDVVRLRHQIADLQAQIERERVRREEGKRRARTRGETYVDDNVTLSPLYQRLRTQLSQSKTQIATLETRLKRYRKSLEEELERTRRMHDVQARIAELNRDYEVNRQIYNDLLRRRENARVSMNLDVEHKGLSLEVYEPAYLPLKPVGLRFLHFAIVGLLLGIAVPLGVILAKVELDPRIRLASVIEQQFGLPVISEVPHWATREEHRRVHAELKRLGAVIAVTLVVYIGLGVGRFAGVI